MSNRSGHKDEPQQVSDKERDVLLGLFEGSLPLSGDAVEFGCYRGDTSILFERVLEKWLRSRSAEDTEQAPRLFLYDSFAGLPEKTSEDSSAAGDQFKAGELFVTKREVVERFRRAGLRVPRIRKAFFEDLDPAADVPEKICFGFLDGDLYGSIRTSLALTGDRVVPGGVLAVHDYDNSELPGVTRAVSEWLQKNKSRVASFSRRETLAVIRFK